MPKKQPEVIFLDDSGETGMQNFASKLVNWGSFDASELGQDRGGSRGFSFYDVDVDLIKGNRQSVNFRDSDSEDFIGYFL